MMRRLCEELTYLIDNTNQAEFELYAVIGEHDNAGYPIAYCLLTTAMAIADSKRKLALASFLKHVRNTYQVHPTFTHTDKDPAEIGACEIAWPGRKHVICRWHWQKAVHERLCKPALATTKYDATAAHLVYSFINTHFVPDMKPDPKDDEDQEYEPNARPVRTKMRKGPKAKGKQAALTSTIPHGPGANSIVFKIPITQSFKDAHPPIAVEKSKSTTPCYKKETTFCPTDLHNDILNMMEHHSDMHTTIPGNHAPTVEGIREWCVREMYLYCRDHGLCACWAYLWGNWYKRGRWELWVRAENTLIPRLRTTMICESQ